MKLIASELTKARVHLGLLVSEATRRGTNAILMWNTIGFHPSFMRINSGEIKVSAESIFSTVIPNSIEPGTELIFSLYKESSYWGIYNIQIPKLERGNSFRSGDLLVFYPHLNEGYGSKYSGLDIAYAHPEDRDFIVSDLLTFSWVKTDLDDLLHLDEY